MPISTNQYQILTPEQANPQRTNMMKNIEALLNASSAGYNFSRTQEQMAKNPYVGDTMKADLAKKILENQWYGKDKQSEINLRNDTGAHYRSEDALTDYKKEHHLYYPDTVQLLDYANRLPKQTKSQEMNATDRVNYELQRNANDLPRSQMQPMPSIDLQKPQLKLPSLSDRMNMELQNSLMPEYLKPKNIPNQSIPELPVNVPQQQATQQPPVQQERMIPGTGIPSRGNPIADAIYEKAFEKKQNLFKTATAQDQGLLMSNIQKDNPNFTVDQIYDAVNNISEGRPQLSDGTPVRIGYLTRQTLDKVNNQGRTATEVTGIHQAKQADAEIKVFSKYADQFLKPYGRTYKGYSPAQIIDSFKSDNASQDKLGDFVAGQAIQYEIAQQRIRLAGGRPGLNSTRDLMNESMQHINTAWPTMSQRARERASNKLNQVFSEGLAAREEVFKNPMGFNTQNGQVSSSGSKYGHLSLEELKARQRELSGS